jgi:3-oxoacyl-[acyl-carrier-protein] synthase-3
MSKPGDSVVAPITVTGTGLFLPERVVTNEELARSLETTDEWIVAHTGIHERRQLAPELATSDMCIAAAIAALENATLSPIEIDVIIVGTYTYDQPLPSTALIVKDALGAGRALPIDINQAACVNGLQAMFIAANLLQSPTIHTALVIAADCASRVTDPHDRATRIFFGDAAAALVVSPTTAPGAGLLSWDFGSALSYGVEISAGGSRSPSSLETVARRGQYLRMDGKKVWHAATENVPSSIRAAASKAGMLVSEIDHFFLHQANRNIIAAAMDDLGLPLARAPMTLEHLGNTGSAGVFTTLHQSFSSGLLHRGDTYVLSAIGAGFQWGTLCLRH